VRKKYSSEDGMIHKIIVVLREIRTLIFVNLSIQLPFLPSLYKVITMNN